VATSGPVVYTLPPYADHCELYSHDAINRSKRDHVRELLTHVVYHKQLPFQAVLMETWYATKDLLLCIEAFPKFYYCPLKDKRQGDDTNSAHPFRRVDVLEWRTADWVHGKRIKIKGFPKDQKVPRFRVAVFPHRTDSVVTNDLAQDATEATQEVCGFRWKLEQGPREGKQVTGLERRQCRTARIQRNHIGCAFLGWVRHKELAAQTGRTVYQLQHSLLDEYLFQQLRNPSLRMVLA
jgi:hypothetical protein